MRQSCSVLDKKKILITFIFATILFTYGYEGVISSFMTVPPPFKVFKTLRELIMDAKYKIMIPAPVKTSPSQFFNSEKYQWIFKTENIILNQSNLGLYFNPIYGTAESYFGFFLRRCNVAVAYPPNQLEYWEYYGLLLRRIKGIGFRCYRADQIIAPLDRPTYIVFGHYKKYVMREFQKFVESGVFGMYANFQSIINTYTHRMLKESLEYQDKQPVAFNIKDMKILSIFLIWGSGLIVSFLIYAMEHCVNIIKVIRLKLVRLKNQMIRLGILLLGFTKIVKVV